jgi:hypothetical protein
LLRSSYFHYDLRVENGVPADHDIFAHYRKRPDRGVLAYLGARRDRSQRVNAGRGAGRRVEQLQCPREVDEAGNRVVADGLGDRMADARVFLTLWAYFGFARKVNWPGARLFHARQSLDLDLRIAHQPAAQCRGDFT